jgi:Lon-like ATP-dependent protease
VFAESDPLFQIYRKAALRLVQDLGEEVFAESQNSPASAVTTETNEDSSGSADPLSSSAAAPASNITETETTSRPQEVAEEDDEKSVTTQERPPLIVPSTVHVRITPETLKDYVGPPVYQKDRMYTTLPPPGVSTGLGYLGNGSGAVMPVEAMVHGSFTLSDLITHNCSQCMPGKGGLQLTGKLGEVIRESAQIGLSWVKGHAFELGITQDRGEQFLHDKDVHVHMPEGSIGKEGPSAGTAILSALVSLFTRTRVNPDIGAGLV